MSGLRKICKLYGRMKIGDTMWVWDYVKDEPRIESEMSKEEIIASEKIKWELAKNQLNLEDSDTIGMPKE